ncbi:hypothetical protein S245_016894, partial [Arachis hypogaea]
IVQEEQQRTSSQQVVRGDAKKKAKVILSMFVPRTTPGTQPSLKSVLKNKEAIHEVDKWFAWWILDCKILFNVVMLPFFQDMLDGVADIGPGYKGSSYDKLMVHLLADRKRECQMLVDSYRSAWRETRCTLMAGGWTDQRQRTLINFLVYYSKGLCLGKSIDAFSIIKNALHLYNLFSEVIEWIDPDDIVHVVTDNTANYVTAVEAIKEIYLYRDRKECFDRREAILAVSKLKPDEWWRLFGNFAPCLQKIAVRILSQSSASSGCERNWSLFYQIHTKRRNRLEHDRLNDIIYVTYNLRLKS